MANVSVTAYNPELVCEIDVLELEYQQDLAVRIYQPKGTGPFPALLDIHGGAWSIGDRTSGEVRDRALAESGIVVAAIEFRLAPEHPYPAQVADFNLAVRWLKSRAADFQGDPQSVGAIGSSSGGHTVLLSAMRPHHPSYSSLDLPDSDVDATLRYVLSVYPIVDPYARYQFAQETEKTFLVESSEGYFLTTDAMKEGNPLQILQRRENAHLPPALIVQGTADENLPVQVTEQFADAYREAGGTIELEIFQDTAHGFAEHPGPETDRAVALMKKFVARCLTDTA